MPAQPTRFSRVSIGYRGDGVDVIDDTGPYLSVGSGPEHVFGSLDGGSVVFNERGLDIDFRVEGDTDVNLLQVDAGNDRVGISTSAPATTLDVDGNVQFGETFAASITRIASSIVSVDVGGVATSETTTVQVTVNGAEANDTVIANPSSRWSGEYQFLTFHTVVSADSTVDIVFSNFSGNDITADTLNWRITALAF